MSKDRAFERRMDEAFARVLGPAHDRQHAVRACAHYPRWRWLLLRWWRRYIPLILVYCGCCQDGRALHDMRLHRFQPGGFSLGCRRCAPHRDSPEPCPIKADMDALLAEVEP
jgi:hypothetical protein